MSSKIAPKTLDPVFQVAHFSRLMRNVRGAIEEEIAAILTENGVPFPQFSDSSRLIGEGIGLHSMEFAVLVVRLERRLGCDPFNAPDLEKFPVTLGDLTQLYEKALERFCDAD